MNPLHTAGGAERLTDTDEPPREYLRALSRGVVVDAPASGPVFDPAHDARRVLAESTLVPVLDRAGRLRIRLLSLGWLICLALFWTWWLQPEHRTSYLGLVVNSLLLAYLSLMPVYFVLAVNRLRRVDPTAPVPDLRVAFVVTRAPSEPWQVARATLEAMRNQAYPHGYDVWLCDERPTPQIRRWCAENGVGLSSREGVAAYHRASWPRRTRCKEGNLAYFYDHRGYRDYDVVAQLDVDHVPGPHYLAAMVRPFADEAVGYVAAPSVCDANAAGSWSARGRLHREAAFHGPFQNGHNGGFAPSCIGSHYAVRTAALREIGGLGPELAEDFSTTFLLASAGWQGIFAIDAEAHGDGPLSFSAMAVQEFQWARSLSTLLLGLVPRHLVRMPLLLRVRFLFAFSYYPLVVTTMAAGLVLPFVAAVTGRPWASVNYFAFLLLWGTVSLWLLLTAAALRRQGLLRPHRAPLISWENALYFLARWPYIARGIGSALLQTVRPRQVTFRVTPKGVDGLERLPVRLVLPYAVISTAMSGAALWGEHHTDTAGYVFLCLLAAVSYAVVAVAVPVLHAREAARAHGIPVAVARSATVAPALALAAATVVPAVLAVALYPGYALPIFGF